jgi:ATP-dependent helicase HrpB
MIMAVLSSLLAMTMIMAEGNTGVGPLAFAALPLCARYAVGQGRQARRVRTRPVWGHAGRSGGRPCGLKMMVASAEAELPITPLLPGLIASLDKNPNLVLQAPPGAGKTTSVPLALLRDSAWMRGSKGQLLVLEPRRIAARGAATRMAAALGEKVGETVGYRVRQESRVSARTRIVCVTEGMLLRQLQNDPLLEGVAGICFDEFHERSTDGDLCLTLCREAQQQALPDLRLLVMSATLGDGLVEQLSSLLDSCPTLVSEGRCFPVTISHSGSMPLAGVASMRRRELAATVAAAVLKVLERDKGDVLVFLPGEAEIRDTAQALADSMQARMSAEVEITPLYAALPLEQQTAAVLPHPKGLRRAVLATSIAESSLTLPRVTAVVDCGLRRISSYEPATGMSGLKTIPISAASAAQVFVLSPSLNRNKTSMQNQRK